MTKRATPIRETVTYLVWRCDPVSERQTVSRVTVPSTWNLTFGPMMGAPRHINRQGAPVMEVTLRFYEGKLQRACIPNVTQFCDESIRWEDAVEYTALSKLNNGKVEVTPL